MKLGSRMPFAPAWLATLTPEQKWLALAFCGGKLGDLTLEQMREVRRAL